MSNPILDEAVKAVAAQRASLTDAQRVQYPDVIIKTTVMFVIAVVAALAAWVLIPDAFAYLAMLGTTIAAFVVALIAMRQRTPSAPLPLLYAVLEGAAIGLISQFFALRYGSDIIISAVTATAVVFAVCLGVYRVPFVRNGNQGRKFLIIALFSFIVFSVLNFLFAVFTGAGDGWGVYGMGPMGMALAVGVLLLSAWTLITNFGDVENAVDSGAPEPYSWILALGLFVATVFVYINILRILGLARR